MNNRHYILKGKEAVPVGLMEWATWFENFDNRSIASTDLFDGKVTVSTVFLGIDHSFMDDGPPLIFESMIFGGVDDNECIRYATYAEAEAGHLRLVEIAKNLGLSDAEKTAIELEHLAAGDLDTEAQISRFFYLLRNNDDG